MPSIKFIQPITFTVQQTRQQIIKSILNTSKSKSSWTFSKQKRFLQPKQTMPSQKHSIFQTKKANHQKSFVPRNHSYGFGKAKRKVFTEQSQTPCCWNYNPEEPKPKWKNFPLPQGRTKCISGSYLNKQHEKNPGPARYDVKSLDKAVRYTMRPKTGHPKTYFIQNKEAAQVPGPGKYHEDFQSLARKSFTSKFKQNRVACASIMSKSKRFLTDPDNKSFISTSLYDKLKASWSKGCLMSSQKRFSFIEENTKTYDAPGPGSYELPTEFGHYKKITLNS